MVKARRRLTEAPPRPKFLSQLLSQDLQELSKWHGARPPHEQRRFLRGVDMLYKEFTKLERSSSNPGQTATQGVAELAAAATREKGQDLFAEAAPLALANSASAPSLPSRPIEVLEQRQ